MEGKPKLTSCSCSQRRGNFQGFPQFKSDALFLVDPHQRAKLDMAGLQDFVDSWFSLPKVNVERVEEFVSSFHQGSFRGKVEGLMVSLTEEYLSACLKLLNSASPDAAPNGEKNVHRVSARSFVEFQEYVEECFEGGARAELLGKGWRKSLLQDGCKDLVNFLQQQMWWVAEDAEFVDDIVIQAALGIMSGKQFARAKFISRQMKEDIVEYMDGDEVYRSTVGLRSAQYLSMLIDFQIGEKQPPPDIAINIFDVDEILEEKENQILSLSKQLAVLEEESALLRQKTAWETTHASETEEKLKFQFGEAERKLLQVQTKHIEEQKVAVRQVEEVKAYGKIVYESHIKFKGQNCKLRHQLEEARIQNLALLEELNKLKETASHVQDMALQESPIMPPHNFKKDGIVLDRSTLWTTIWAESNELYLGHFSNLFDNWEDDFPYPKWEALWWIAKDCGQSPPPLQHPSLSKYYSRNSLSMSLKPPEEIANHPDFCKLCDRRWKWFKDGKLDGVHYNWPLIQLDLSSSKACSAS